MNLHGLNLAFEIGAASLAALVARKRREHLPVAAFLIGTVINDLIRLALQTWVIIPARASMRAAGLDPTLVPFTGRVRFAFHIESALFLTWPAGLAALSLWFYLKRRPWPVAVVYAIAVVALVLGYPTIRYDLLRRAYLVAELSALTVGIGSLGQWIGREVPRVQHVVTSCILITELSQLAFGPWRVTFFGGAWGLAQLMYSVLYAVLIILQIGALWLTPSLSRR